MAKNNIPEVARILSAMPMCFLTRNYIALFVLEVLIKLLQLCSAMLACSASRAFVIAVLVILKTSSLPKALLLMSKIVRY